MKSKLTELALGVIAVALAAVLGRNVAEAQIPCSNAWHRGVAELPAPPTASRSPLPVPVRDSRVAV